MDRFNLNKLKEVEGNEQYCAEVSNRFAALEDLDTEVEINSVWETITKNTKISAKEIKGNKLNCSDYRIQVIYGDNPNNVRREETYISGIKKGNIGKTELMSLQQIVRTRTSETHIAE
jgi:hypothetical protein